MQYEGHSDAVRAHFEHPRNVGTLDKKSIRVGTGIAGEPDCGDLIKLQIEVDHGRIVDARFKTFGCGAAIAASSLTTEWLKGGTLDDARGISNAAITEALSLPEEKQHCSVLAEQAVAAAIADYERKLAATTH